MNLMLARGNATQYDAVFAHTMQVRVPIPMSRFCINICYMKAYNLSNLLAAVYEHHTT